MNKIVRDNCPAAGVRRDLPQDRPKAMRAEPTGIDWVRVARPAEWN